MQDDADVRLSHRPPLTGWLRRVRYGQDKAGLQIDEIRNFVRFQVAAQKVEKPTVKAELKPIVRGFCLQPAVVPFIADVDIGVGVLIPSGPVLFQGDITAVIGRELIFAAMLPAPIFWARRGTTAIFRVDIRLFPMPVFASPLWIPFSLLRPYAQQVAL